MVLFSNPSEPRVLRNQALIATSPLRAPQLLTASVDGQKCCSARVCLAVAPASWSRREFDVLEGLLVSAHRYALLPAHPASRSPRFPPQLHEWHFLLLRPETRATFDISPSLPTSNQQPFLLILDSKALQLSPLACRVPGSRVVTSVVAGPPAKAPQGFPLPPGSRPTVAIGPVRPSTVPGAQQVLHECLLNEHREGPRWLPLPQMQLAPRPSAFPLCCAGWVLPAHGAAGFLPTLHMLFPLPGKSFLPASHSSDLNSASVGVLRGHHQVPSPSETCPCLLSMILSLSFEDMVAGGLFPQIHPFTHSTCVLSSHVGPARAGPGLTVVVGPARRGAGLLLALVPGWGGTGVGGVTSGTNANLQR